MRTTEEQLAEATLVRRAATSLAARARTERGGVLTLNEVAVLGRVVVLGPITPREIGAQLRMLPQSLTRVLASLEIADLVLRHPNPDDGRGALLAATTAGRRALRDEMAPRDRWVAGSIAAVCTDAERQTLRAAAEIMLRLVDHGGGVAPVEP